MKTISRFENSERLVKITQFSENDYIVSVNFEDGTNYGKRYKSLRYAKIQFATYRDYPKEVISKYNK